jgi:hypothetical protein
LRRFIKLSLGLLQQASVIGFNHPTMSPGCGF